MAADYIVGGATTRMVVAMLADGQTAGYVRELMRFLGIPDAHLISGTPTGTFMDPQDGVLIASRMAAAISDDSARRATVVLEQLKAHPLYADDEDAVVDVVTAQWMRDHDIALAETYLLCSLSEELHVDRRNGRSIDGMSNAIFLARDTEPHSSLELLLNMGQGMRWTGGTLVIMDGTEYSETVRSQAVGRPLRDVFRHPRLNDLDLKVVSWDEPNEIVTDAPKTPIFRGRTIEITKWKGRI